MRCLFSKSAIGLALLASAAGVFGQSRLPTMPGYERYEKMRREIPGSIRRGALQVQWDGDGKTFTYTVDGKRYKYDVATRTKTVVESSSSPEPEPQPRGRRGIRGQRPERGRQFTEETSPDAKSVAFYRDRNVWIRPAAGPDGESAITTEGNAEKRIKLGTASWVYGEELGVLRAMFWSPDSKKLAYYRFDESKVLDYFLPMEVTQIQDKLDVEPYVKAGAPNPEVSLIVYDLDSKSTKTLDTKFGPDGEKISHYLYDVRWSPDGKELFFYRTDRLQKVMEFCAANPDTGKCRVIVREEWQPGWTENHPPMQYLTDNKRFLWISERNGYRNIYLGNLDGSPLRPVTQHQFEVGGILKVDEKQNLIWYTARDGETPFRVQMHRVSFDGKGDKRLTDPALNHSVNLSPDGKNFTDVVETWERAPETRLCDGEGKVLDTLLTSDLSKFNELGLKPVEWFKYKAMDGVTDCWGRLNKPSNFDPSKKYPLIVSVYAGPESGGGTESFQSPDPLTELGFLVANFDGRGTDGRGKAFKDALYAKLGVVEIDDQAAGVKALTARPYVDGSRVGIHGSSYGGYSSVMAILRYPDLFHVAVASSSVTDWRNYDSIYTERYMGLPDEGANKKGYDDGSAMKYAGNLKGYLLLFYGTADNNVHPANSYQLARALQRAGKSFDMMAGPDMGHSGVNPGRMLEYFIEHLILERELSMTKN